MRSYKKLLTLAALFVLVFTGIAAIEEPAGEFKNLQVLPKNIRPDSLDKLMDGYNKALGVDCGFCHVKDKNGPALIMEKDDKPEKEITRNMMRMTMDINKKYFDFSEDANAKPVEAVTCYTCHKGQPMPEKEKKPVNKDPFNFKKN